MKKRSRSIYVVVDASSHILCLFIATQVEINQRDHSMNCWSARYSLESCQLQVGMNEVSFIRFICHLLRIVFNCARKNITNITTNYNYNSQEITFWIQLEVENRRSLLSHMVKAFLYLHHSPSQHLYTSKNLYSKVMIL